MTLPRILAGWGLAFLTWILEPTESSAKRIERWRKQERLREAQRAIRS